MNPEYSDQETERVRRAEQSGQQVGQLDSSAGKQTQRINLEADYEPVVPVPPSAVVQSTIADRRNNVIALVLILVGAVMLLARFLPDPEAVTGGMVLLIISSCFLFFSFWQRLYGLLIPGCILAGLSMGVPFADVTGGVSVLWGLAMGFMSIKLVGRILFGEDSIWPVIPGVILFAVGMIAAVSQLPALFAGGLIWLPILLIGLGLFLGARRTR